MRENNSRETILTCALDLFSQTGYDAVSITDIVEKAGITKPTLYYFFGNKEGLFAELLESNYTTLDKQLQAACLYSPKPEHYNEDVRPLLLRIVDTYFSYAKEHTKFYLMALTLSFAPPSSRPAAMAEPYLKAQYLLLENTFKEVAKVHSNLAGKERAASWEFAALINAHIGFWNHGHGKIDKLVAEHIVNQFMHGLFA
jgi:AcrR family transcriptional regulator